MEHNKLRCVYCLISKAIGLYWENEDTDPAPALAFMCSKDWTHTGKHDEEYITWFSSDQVPSGPWQKECSLSGRMNVPCAEDIPRVSPNTCHAQAWWDPSIKMILLKPGSASKLLCIWLRFSSHAERLSSRDALGLLSPMLRESTARHRTKPRSGAAADHRSPPHPYQRHLAGLGWGLSELPPPREGISSLR